MTSGGNSQDDAELAARMQRCALALRPLPSTPASPPETFA